MATPLLDPTYLITNIEHYFNFTDEFAMFPLTEGVDFMKTEQYEQIKELLENIKGICKKNIEEKISQSVSSVNFRKYNYKESFTMNKIPLKLTSYNLYNDVYLLVDFIKKKIDVFSANPVMKKYFTDEDIAYITNLNPSEIPNIRVLHEYISDLRRRNDFFNKNFMSSLVSLSEGTPYFGETSHNYEIFYIGGEGHAMVLLKIKMQDGSSTIIFYDPSFDEGNNKHTFFLDLFGINCNEKFFLSLNVQHVNKTILDIFCVFWCLHFLYYILVVPISIFVYGEMFKIVQDKDTYIREIKIFILQNFRNDELFAEHAGTHWGGYKQKYLKYKQKYIQLKNTI